MSQKDVLDDLWKSYVRSTCLLYPGSLRVIIIVVKE